MSKRSLSLMIAAALFGAGTVAAQSGDALYQRSTETPPPAAAASMSGQTHVPDQADLADQRCLQLGADDADFDHEACLEHERAQAALEDRDLDLTVQQDDDTHTVVRRDDTVHAGFEGDTAVAAGDDFDEVEVAEGEAADGMAMDDTAVATADDVEVRTAESDPFAEEAGSEGFSSGATASAAEREFERLGGGGELSREQVADTELAARFEDYDINDDGSIAENEFQSWFAASRAVESAPDTGYAASDDDVMQADVDADVAEADVDADADTEVATVDADDMDVDADVDADVVATEDGVDVDVDADADVDTGLASGDDDEDLVDDED